MLGCQSDNVQTVQSPEWSIDNFCMFQIKYVSLKVASLPSNPEWPILFSPEIKYLLYCFADYQVTQIVVMTQAIQDGTVRPAQ
jgi:hypothetical protein